MRELLRRIHYLFNRRRIDAELADEMAFHREMAQRKGGVPFGDTPRLREDSREAWGVSTIDPIAYVSAIVVFLFAVGLAALWPARRAPRVDPLVALRCD